MKKPKKATKSYLTGWFLVETHGNHKKARKLAMAYLKEQK